MSANKFRRKWQDYANQNAKIAENNFYTVFHNIFENTEFNIRAKPNEFSHLYLNTVLSDEEKLAIFQPEIPIIKHGIFPDYAIDHLQTGVVLK